MTATTNQEAFRGALSDIPRFVYANGLALAVVSVLWFLASLPLITIGPATLAAYVAVQDLRSDRNRIDRDRVVAVLRDNGVASAVFSGVPVTFGAVSAAYGITAFQRGSLLGEAIALVAAYIALYVALALVPTFVRLARGEGPVSALRYGLRWLVRHPTPALAMGLVTFAVLAVTALLTVAFVLVFAGLAFSIQIAVVDTLEERSLRTTTAEDTQNTANT